MSLRRMAQTDVPETDGTDGCSRDGRGRDGRCTLQIVCMVLVVVTMLLFMFCFRMMFMAQRCMSGLFDDSSGLCM